MKVVATRKVFYSGSWYSAGDEFECKDSDFPGLEVAGVEKSQGKAEKPIDRSVKKYKKRDLK
jgi:hypothetical protein